jgi:hypothetical protein
LVKHHFEPSEEEKEEEEKESCLPYMRTHSKDLASVVSVGEEGPK